jgi:hypothetical protein
LKSLALPVRARGHSIAFAVRDPVRTRRLLHDLDVPRFQAPLFSHRVEGLPPGQASLADILPACGWIDADAIAGFVEGWRALMLATRAELIVCDYAPRVFANLSGRHPGHGALLAALQVAGCRTRRAQPARRRALRPGRAGLRAAACGLRPKAPGQGSGGQAGSAIAKQEPGRPFVDRKLQ